MANTLTDELYEKMITIVQDWANDSLDEARKNLRSRLKTHQESELAQSLQFDSIINNNGTVRVSWSMDDYGYFVDLGVRGTVNRVNTFTNEEFPSGFQFKNARTPKQMINTMRDYISRKGLPITQRKNQSPLEALEQQAWSMAKAIKRKGISGTRFYSDVFNEQKYQELMDTLARELSLDLEIKVSASFIEK